MEILQNSDLLIPEKGLQLNRYVLPRNRLIL